MNEDEAPSKDGGDGDSSPSDEAAAIPAHGPAASPVPSVPGTSLPPAPPPTPAPPPSIPDAPNLASPEGNAEEMTAEQLARLLDSWDDDELDRLDDQAAAKEGEAENLTHFEIFVDRLKHLFFTTVWFVIFAAVAILLDLFAPYLRCWGVTENTQWPLEMGAHLLMYADLILLSIQLLETIGVQAVRAYRKVTEAKQ